jgi:autotransporter-associated beta strand protein
MKTPFRFFLLPILGSQAVYAASDTWKSSPTSGNWNTGGNWVGGSNPGDSLTTASNTDIATFNSASSQLTVNLAASRNLGGITFDSEAAAYTLTTTSSSVRYFFTRGGTTQMTSTVTNNQTISGTMRIGAGISGSNNNYTFLNNASTAIFTLGSIRNDSGTSTTVILGGSNTGVNIVSGVIDETLGSSLSLTKNDAGNWTLGGQNSYTGTTTVNAGTLTLGNNSALGNSSLSINGGTLDIATFTTSASNVVLTEGLIKGSGTLTGLTSNFDVRSGTVEAKLGGSVGLNKTTTGTVILSGQNTYTGTTTLNAGTLAIGNNSALGNSAVTINGGTLASRAFARTLTNNITADGDFTLGGLSYAITLNGTMSLGAATRTITLSNSATLGGVISNGGLTLASSSAARSLTLNGAGSNTYTGLTTVSGGTLILAKTDGAVAVAGDLTISGTVLLGANGQVASSKTITVNSGGTLDLATYNNSATNVVLAGGLIKGSGTLTGLTNPFDLRAGTVEAVLSGSVGLNKTTSGIVTLSNGANSFTGTVTLGGGQLDIVSAGALGSGLITTSTNGTGSIGLATASASAVTLTNAVHTSATSTNLMTFAPTSGKQLTLSGQITGSGILKISGNGDLVLSNTSNSYSGGTDIGSGRILTGNAATLGSGAVNFSTSTNSHLVATSDLTITNAMTMNGSNFTANLDTNGHSMSISGGITSTGSGRLNKLGAGTLTLTGTNTYSGTTTVTAGVLAVNGTLASTSTTVTSGGTLRGSGSISGNVFINGGGTLASGNSIESLAVGTLNLANASTFAYEINKDAAASVAGDLTAITGNLNITSGAILALDELGSLGSWVNGSKLTLASYSGSWNSGLFTYGGVTLADDTIISFSNIDWFFNYNDTAAGTNYVDDLGGATGFVTMTAVPETEAALLGGLGCLLLLRRKR